MTIGDRAMVHCTGVLAEHPTKIGDGVVIGSGAIVHGCDVGDYVHIGEGAQILDGAVVGRHSIITPGAVVGPSKQIGQGEVWGGVPAKFIRNVTDAEMEKLSVVTAENTQLAMLHAKEDAKTFVEIEEEAYDYEQTVGRSDYYYRRMSKEVRRLFRVEP